MSSFNELKGFFLDSDFIGVFLKGGFWHDC